MKHASIIPLIGGESIGVEAATGSPPEFLLSYTPFAANDSHLVNYYEQRGLDVPYHDLDTGPPPFSTSVDAVSSVCPCAGLSALSSTSGADNPANDWMYKTAEYVMGEMKPTVYWGENAPALYTDKGAPVRDKLMEIGEKHGYTASFYKTKSLLHGIPQIRMRCFFFFWKGRQAPVMEYFDRPYQTIEDLIVGVKSNSQREPINPKTPSEDPYYAYVLEVLAGGITHREFAKRVGEFRGSSSVRSNDVLCIIEASEGYTPQKMYDWYTSRGMDKPAKLFSKIIKNAAEGRGAMKRGVIVPAGYIGAFVSHYPHVLTHPVEDRFIDYREAMAIMGLPGDFELLNPKRSVNHICQNVPVQTAADMATEVAACLGSPSSRKWVDGPVMQDNLKRQHRTAQRSSMSQFFS